MCKQSSIILLEESGYVMGVIHTTYSEMLDIPNKNGCYIDEYGTKFYYNNNLLHRDGDLPAIEWNDGEKHWYRKCMSHRLYGPAVEWCDGGKSWYLFDTYYTEDEHNRIISNLPLLYWNNRDML